MLFEPEQDEVLRALPRVKEELRVNVELASPGDFIDAVDSRRSVEAVTT